MPKKSYAPDGRSCRIEFEAPAFVDARVVCLCGDFNGWSRTAHPMQRLKNGRFVLAISLEPGQTYRYRYVLDHERWENDATADGYIPNAFGSQDSLVEV